MSEIIWLVIALLVAIFPALAPFFTSAP